MRRMVQRLVFQTSSAIRKGEGKLSLPICYDYLRKKLAGAEEAQIPGNRHATALPAGLAFGPYAVTTQWTFRVVSIQKTSI